MAFIKKLLLGRKKHPLSFTPFGAAEPKSNPESGISLYGAQASATIDIPDEIKSLKSYTLNCGAFGECDFGDLGSTIFAINQYLPLTTVYIYPNLELSISFSKQQEEGSILRIDNFEAMQEDEYQERLMEFLSGLATLTPQFFTKIKIHMDDFCNAPEVLFKHFFSCIIQPNTTHLNIANSLLWNLPAEQYTLFFAYLNNHQSLKHLVLSEVPLTEENKESHEACLNITLAPLQSCPALTSIELRSTDLGILSKENFSKMIHLLKAIPLLNSLNLGASYLKDHHDIRYHQLNASFAKPFELVLPRRF